MMSTVVAAAEATVLACERAKIVDAGGAIGITWWLIVSAMQLPLFRGSPWEQAKLLASTEPNCPGTRCEPHTGSAGLAPAAIPHHAAHPRDFLDRAS